jgi:2-methylisocitrate lyase-like PEP mutase family enzyme
MSDLADRFLGLHVPGEPLLLANAYDAGTAKVLAHVGFKALATTSSGHAGTLGRRDGRVTRDEAIAHAATLAAATTLPLNADLEHGFADDADGVAETIRLAAAAGVAGASIEDHDPVTGGIYERERARERVAAAAEAAHGAPARVVLTARCENHLHGINDLDDTIARLLAYVAAGAEVVYAPGLVDLGEISTVVKAVGVPVNVLIVPGGPSVAQLGEAGARRISTGGTLAKVAFGAMVLAAERLRDEGVVATTEPFLSRKLAAGALHD